MSRINRSGIRWHDAATQAEGAKMASLLARGAVRSQRQTARMLGVSRTTVELIERSALGKVSCALKSLLKQEL